MSLNRFKSLPLLPAGVLIFLVTMGVFGAVIAWVSLLLREELRNEMTDRDTRAIAALLQLEADQARELYADYPAGLRNLLEAGEVLVSVSSYHGLIAAAITDESGELLEAIPFDLNLFDALPEEWQKEAPDDRSRSLFQGNADLSAVLPGIDGGDTAPLLHVRLPMDDPEIPGLLRGHAYFILDGSSLQAAFADLDDRLLNQAVLALSTAGILVLLILAAAFWRLDQSRKDIEARTVELTETNRSLNLALKNSAIGNVTAHLLHDLKNPLWGLLLWVESAHIKQDRDSPDIPTWDEAKAYIERIQNLIEEVTGMLQENTADGAYDIPFTAWYESFLDKVRQRAEAKLIKIAAGPAPEADLDNLQAGLCSSILLNLVQNAIDATPIGGTLRILPSREGEALSLVIQDEGPGLPERVRERLFQPLKSTKANGTGIGLAISHQLARAMDAELRLDRTSKDGTAFSLNIPLKTSVTV